MTQRNLPAPQQQRPNTAMTTSRVVSGTLTRLDNRETRTLTTWNPEEAVAWIEEAAEKGIVVTPSMMPVFPHGRGMAVSIVRITDFDAQGTQLYPIPGSNKLGLHKNVLDEIGRGFAIDWPPDWTFREPFTLPGAQSEDPRDKDPYCIKITVCGRYKRFDGTWATLPALTKEIDLREGSAEVEQIRTRQAASNQNNPTLAKSKADAEIGQLRKFIRAHAQTKARLQVIRTLVRSSYTLDELRKGPFYVFSSVWTGRSDNADIDFMLAQGALDMEKEGRAMLYAGTAVPAPKALPEVSERPYTDDAEMVAYNEAMKGQTAAEGTTPPADPVASTAAAAPSDEPKQCTPDQCFGRLSSAHVKACFAPLPEQLMTSTAQTSAPPPAAPWIITDGGCTGLAVTDEKVTPEMLSSLLDFYIDRLEGNAELGEAEIKRLKAKRDHVETELQRRGVIPS